MWTPPWALERRQIKAIDKEFREALEDHNYDLARRIAHANPGLYDQSETREEINQKESAYKKAQARRASPDSGEDK